MQQQAVYRLFASPDSPWDIAVHNIHILYLTCNLLKQYQLL